MFLSKRSNGIYYIFYQSPSGKRACKSTGSKLKAQATKYLSNFGKQLDEGRINKTIAISVKDFLFQFLCYSESVHSPKHTHSLRATFKAFTTYLPNTQLDEINQQTIQGFVDARLKRVSSYSVKRDIADLSSAFSWGISKNYLITNYCQNIKKPKIIEKIPTFFSENGLNRLLAVVENRDLKDLIRFAVNTGLRQSELISLQWRQVNFRDNYLILDNTFTVTKSKKVRTIPLNLNALQILTERQIGNQSDYVFTYLNLPIKQQFISHKFKKLIKNTTLNSRLNFHSLRHTFASWLVQRGVSIYEVSKLLGHSDIRVTQIYTHLKPENLRNAVELLN